MSAVACVRDISAATKSPELARLTREFLVLTVVHNCRVCPGWIAGKSNVLLDALSRQLWPVVASSLQEHLVEAGGGVSPFLASLARL